MTAIRSFAALEAGYDVVVGASTAIDEMWDDELIFRRKAGQLEQVEWNLNEKADKHDWENWFNELGTPLRSQIMLIVLNDTQPFGGSAPPPVLTQSPTTNSITSPSASGKKRRTFASAVAFQQVASEWNFLVNVADAPTLSDFTWPITHRFTLSPPPAHSNNISGLSSSSTTLSHNTKSPLQMALTTNSSVCRLTSRIKREIVAALPETIGSAVLAVANLRSDLILRADEASNAQEELEAEQQGWKDDEEDEEEALNRPVQQLTSEQAEALDQLSLGGGGRSREKSEAEIVEERTMSPCRARALSRSRSRSTGGRSDIRSA